MTFYHSRDCRFSPMFPHCNCGASDAVAQLELLESRRDADIRAAFLAGVGFGEGWSSDTARLQATGDTDESAADQYVIDNPVTKP